MLKELNEIKKEKQSKLLLRIDLKDLQDLTSMAKREKVNRTKLVQAIIKDFLKRNRGK
jgi:hypothetical protein